MFTRQASSALASTSSTYARATNHARQSLRSAKSNQQHGSQRHTSRPSETTRRCYASLARWMRTSDHAGWKQGPSGGESSAMPFRVDARRPSLEGEARMWNGKGGRRQTRGIHSTAVSQHNHLTRPAPGTGITIHFKDSKGTLLKTIEANPGDSILDLAHEHDIDLEGACEGSVACSTCHVILSPEHYDLLEEPDDDENDMLDMAFGLTDTSRLGCQVIMKKELEGIVVTLPSATRNMYVDGAKPTAH